jgi:hypothetical protein
MASGVGAICNLTATLFTSALFVLISQLHQAIESRVLGGVRSFLHTTTGA